jgi:hypothetical protein
MTNEPIIKTETPLIPLHFFFTQGQKYNFIIAIYVYCYNEKPTKFKIFVNDFVSFDIIFFNIN